MQTMQTCTRGRNLAQILHKKRGFQHGLHRASIMPKCDTHTADLQQSLEALLRRVGVCGPFTQDQLHMPFRHSICHHGCNALLEHRLWKHGVAWNSRSSTTLGSQAKCLYTMGSCKMHREVFNKEAHDQAKALSDTMCNAPSVCPRLCYNLRHYGRVCLVNCGPHKYVFGIGTYSLRNCGSISTVAFDPNMKNQMEGSYILEACGVCRQGAHEKLYHQAFGSKASPNTMGNCEVRPHIFRNPEYSGHNFLLNGSLHKYGFGIHTIGLSWSYRSLSTKAVDPDVKSKVEGLCAFMTCGTHKKEVHGEACEEKLDTMCKEGDTETIEAILRMWDRFFLSWMPKTLLQLASVFIDSACIRLDNSNAKRDPTIALAFGQRALRAFESHQPYCLKHASCLCLVGYAHKEMGELEKAVARVEEATLILEHSKATNLRKDPLAWKAEELLVLCKRLLNRPGHESIPHIERYIKLSEKLLNPGDRALGLCYQVGGQAYCEANQPYDSLHCCSKALPILKRHDGLSSPQVALIHHIRSKAYLSLGKYKIALVECGKARPFIEKAGMVVSDVDLVYAKCLLDLQEYKKAILLLKEMLKNSPKTSCIYATTLVLLADVYATQKRERKFAKWCERAINAFSNLEPSINDAHLVKFLSKLVQEQGNNKEALVMKEKALEICNQCMLQKLWKLEKSNAR